MPLAPGPQPDTSRAEDRPATYRFCGNRTLPAACNWLRHADDPNPRCIGCRLNRAIPDLGREDNARYWAVIELAKRRLGSQLLSLELQVKSKVDEDEAQGLMFDFLCSPVDGKPVMTGHGDGLITINVEEADDACREQICVAMHEPYRTLLGHFRHEVGHC